MSGTVARTPGRPVRWTDDNHLAVPLRIALADGHSTDTEWALTLAEAEHLHAALCRALDGQPVPPAAPDCRQTVQTSRSTTHLRGRT
ncbi:hypothetical protein [Streptomyces scabiei]|uniref:hypothetical protein n=1 Tax=Streptomyces scabiei TaxID=1930 RepID=UPI0006290F40|nr:hypothetical protein [Streptomyces scabiei]MDX2837100.1 hypothetical protein [Streptomyces scabiei]MDX3681689.1 hypothetical protein [Streptomyces scabiei]